MSNKPGPDISYQFRNRKLLQAALTHRSYSGEKRLEKKTSLAFRNNEKLEFLGDAVLELVFSEYLFQTELNEASMSRIRAMIVNGPELARAALGIDLDKYLLLGKGEESTGGRKKTSILSGAFEALIGAVFLDSGYEEARRVVLEIFEEKLLKIIQKGKFRDPKTELQEFFQKTYGKLPAYRLLKEEGTEHEKIFTSGVYLERKLYGKGKGRSKKMAETAAASEALKKLAG